MFSESFLFDQRQVSLVFFFHLFVFFLSSSVLPSLRLLIIFSSSLVLFWFSSQHLDFPVRPSGRGMTTPSVGPTMSSWMSWSSLRRLLEEKWSFGAL